MAHIRFSIERIPAAQRTKFISINVPYLENIPDGRQRFAILLAINSIPEKERIPEVINKLIALFKGITDWHTMVSINTTIEQIPAAQRAAVITLAVPYLENITDEQQRDALFLAISKIPEKERVPAVINKLIALFKGITDWQNDG